MNPLGALHRANAATVAARQAYLASPHMATARAVREADDERARVFNEFDEKLIASLKEMQRSLSLACV